ncbi:MAG: hypothetical protein JW791_00395 [Nanoarchaeota archaeon]|nr:hypothetical protein [Nanoarchaeota archaeon]
MIWEFLTAYLGIFIGFFCMLILIVFYSINSNKKGIVSFFKSKNEKEFNLLKYSITAVLLFTSLFLLYTIYSALGANLIFFAAFFITIITELLFFFCNKANFLKKVFPTITLLVFLPFVIVLGIPVLFILFIFHLPEMLSLNQISEAIIGVAVFVIGIIGLTQSEINSVKMWFFIILLIVEELIALFYYFRRIKYEPLSFLDDLIIAKIKLELILSLLLIIVALGMFYFYGFSLFALVILIAGTGYAFLSAKKKNR